MTVRVGINGLGRIGRNVVRALSTRPGTDVRVVAVNDLGAPETMAHLLRHDSVLGTFPGDITVSNDGISIDGDMTRVLSERDPASLPWGDLGVDVVIEATGAFTDAARARGHLDAGASKVIIGAPATGEDATLVLGVNDDVYDAKRHAVISNASCTTNCLAVLAKVLHDTVGIIEGMMTTVHAYTQDQNLHDGPHKDLRRARAAALNIVPASSGAAKAIGIVLPELAGRLDAYALRVPVPVGSITDLTVTVARPTSVEEVNESFALAARATLSHVLHYSEAPLVSSDIAGDPASCVFDAGLTRVNGHQVKIVGWYDNEWGYANRLIDLAERASADA